MWVTEDANIVTLKYSFDFKAEETVYVDSRKERNLLNTMTPIVHSSQYV